MLRTMIPRVIFSFSRQLLNSETNSSSTETKLITFSKKSKRSQVVEQWKSSLEYATSYEPKDEIPEVELKELPPHLEYAFLEENNKLPVIISKDLSQEEKTSLINVLKNRKQAIAWKLSIFEGIDPEFCSHKILLEMDYQPSVPTIKGGFNQKSMDVYQERSRKTSTQDRFYPISDSPWLDQSITMTESSETNYTTTEKEMLAVVYAFEKFRSYLIMNKSIVYTDHSALNTSFKQESAKARCFAGVILLQEIIIDTKHSLDLNTCQLSILNTPAAIIEKLQHNYLSELRDQAYENSLIYKEKTKKLHDSKIKNRIFNVGDQVLLFNSRLKIFSGKLKSRWSGPFTITEVYPYGTAKLSHADGSNFKVNCHRLKHYYGGDTPRLRSSFPFALPKDN
ncbi:reverse transcriptase domain-containing protein [Tanacetum coccineum]